MNKFIIWGTLDGWSGTTAKNYYSYIQNAREIKHFTNNNGFTTLQDVINYITKYFRYSIDDIIII